MSWLGGLVSISEHSTVDVGETYCLEELVTMAAPMARLGVSQTSCLSMWFKLRVETTGQLELPRGSQISTLEMRERKANDFDHSSAIQGNGLSRLSCCCQ